MLTYDLIINKILNMDNHVFLINYDKSDKIDGILKLFFKCMSSDINTNKNKFYNLNEIMNNFYFSINKNKRDEFFDIFCKIQKIYHVLNNFLIRYKNKQ